MTDIPVSMLQMTIKHLQDKCRILAFENDMLNKRKNILEDELKSTGQILNEVRKFVVKITSMANAAAQAQKS